MKERVERRIGRELTHGASGYPPGVHPIEARAKAHVNRSRWHGLQRIDRRADGSNHVLLLREALSSMSAAAPPELRLNDGRVEYTADEPTGGTTSPW